MSLVRFSSGSHLLRHSVRGHEQGLHGQILHEEDLHGQGLHGLRG